jgi:hypothetical protein
LQSRAGAATAAAEAAALSAGAAKTVALNDELAFKGHAESFFGWNYAYPRPRTARRRVLVNCMLTVSFRLFVYVLDCGELVVVEAVVADDSFPLATLEVYISNSYTSPCPPYLHI